MRIVVLFPGALGDLCLLAPALAACATRGARIELSVRRALAPIARLLLPAIATAPPIDGADMASLFADELDPALSRWLCGADVVHAWLARANVDGELAARFARVGVAAHLHAVPRADGVRHVGDDYAEALGLAPPLAPLAARSPAVVTPLPWRRAGATRLVVHPGAGAVAKRWPRAGFRSVAEAWAVGGGEAVVLLGPAEDDDAAWWTAAGCRVATHLDLLEAAALIASAPAWIGNDSGMSHLAGVLGRRGVVLFGPTRPLRWRPLTKMLVPIEVADRALADVARESLDVLRA